ncbi:MAG: hypothetical protein VR64_02100 [Desulfatitalea sp. BRH_c12]|nr:MAG: hypothetical protein VR64_02100 [Desulfatitalea sp. BRH_c12]
MIVSVKPIIVHLPLLALYVDSKIAAQVLIGFFALKIVFTGINVSLTAVIKIILLMILGHDFTSLVIFVNSLFVCDQ